VADSPNSIFLKAFKGNLLTCAFDVMMFLAGAIVAVQLNVFRFSVWAIAIYPSIIVVQSIIGNLLNGHVSTMLHLGTAYPHLTSNTKVFYDLFRRTIFQTIMASVVVSVFAWILGSIFWGVTAVNFPEIFFTVTATMGLGFLIFLFTERMVFMAFSRGLDLERFIHPLILVISGILITGFYVLVLSLPLRFGIVGNYVVASMAFLCIITAVIGTLPRAYNKEFRRIVKEPLIAFIVVGAVSAVTGTIFKKIISLAPTQLEVYTMYPALIFISVNVGLIVGSTATTKLALGLLKPRFRAIRNHAGQIFSGWMASMIAFSVLAGFSLVVNGVFSASSLGRLVAVLFAANIIAIVMIALVAYAFAVLTFQRALELDNFVIPVESALVALMMTIAFFVALVLLRYV